MRAAWLVAASLACSVVSAHAAAPPVESYTLANGLCVLLQEDHVRPRVGIAVSYRVGHRDEPPGYAGITHLVEHLLFSGSLHVPEDRFVLTNEKIADSIRRSHLTVERGRPPSYTKD